MSRPVPLPPRLAAMGNAASRTPESSARTAPAVLPLPAGPSIPLGETGCGTLPLDLNRLLAGRCLIQGSSGAGKSATLRHIIEEAHDYLTMMIVDPEGESATSPSTSVPPASGPARSPPTA